MLAYPLDEAETMLQEKLSAAEASLRNCEEDLEFLREQITVCICIRILVVPLTDWLALDVGSCYCARL